MTRSRRIASCFGALALAWLVALVVMNAVFVDRTRRRIADRLAESLQSEATIGGARLALVRGFLDLDDLAVRRDDVIGRLALTVAGVRCELPPLGLALVDRGCRRLSVRETRLEVSAAALFKLRRPRRPPLRAERVVIDDARLEFSPSAIRPNLGRVAIAIEHAEAGETVFKTPLSWIFALRELRATLDLPAGGALRLSYDHGELRIAGSVFGAAPIALPLAIPAAQAADDARAEIARLVALGADIAERLAVRKAEDWLRSKLSL